MPQNNTDITSSPEFKEFCKKANLEVYNQEAINCLLFANSLIISDQDSKIQKLEERLNSANRAIGRLGAFILNDKEKMYSVELKNETIAFKESNLEIIN